MEHSLIIYTFKMRVWYSIAFQKGSDDWGESAAIFDDDPVDGWHVEQRLGQSCQIRNLFGSPVSRCHQIDNGQI
jgi:hypothetical protein